LQLRYKNQLTQQRNYKTIIAVVLLTLYAFIATPVKLWHHHHYVAASHQTDNTKKVTTQESSKTIEGNCQVCSHHYSVYSDDAIAVVSRLTAVINPKEGFYAFATPLLPYFNSANKGPPGVA
jgi:hypothetical protein